MTKAKHWVPLWSKLKNGWPRLSSKVHAGIASAPEDYILFLVEDEYSSTRGSAFRLHQYDAGAVSTWSSSGCPTKRIGMRRFMRTLRRQVYHGRELACVDVPYGTPANYPG